MIEEEDAKELEALNKAVEDAIAKRREWLDSKMTKYAPAQVGEEIYNLSTGELLGKVVSLYRYWRDRQEGVRDTSLDVEYEYQHPYFEEIIGNTSSKMLVNVGKR